VRQPRQTNMQFYAMQAGFIPFAQLPEHQQYAIEQAVGALCRAAGGARVAPGYWWKRHRSERGWVWEPLRVT
jgi:hypothetical protein